MKARRTIVQALWIGIAARNIYALAQARTAVEDLEIALLVATWALQYWTAEPI